jgi:hypothetical protein
MVLKITEKVAAHLDLLIRAVVTVQLDCSGLHSRLDHVEHLYNHIHAKHIEGVRMYYKAC